MNHNQCNFLLLELHFKNPAMIHMKNHKKDHEAQNNFINSVKIVSHPQKESERKRAKQRKCDPLKGEKSFVVTC